MSRKKDKLTPAWQAPQVKPISQAMQDFAEAMKYGTPVSAIERRAKASMLASQARRRREKETSFLTRALIVGIPIMIVTGIITFLYVLRMLST